MYIEIDVLFHAFCAIDIDCPFLFVAGLAISTVNRLEREFLDAIVSLLIDIF